MHESVKGLRNIAHYIFRTPCDVKQKRTRLKSRWNYTDDAKNHVDNCMWEIWNVLWGDDLANITWSCGSIGIVFLVSAKINRRLYIYNVNNGLCLYAFSYSSWAIWRIQQLCAKKENTLSAHPVQYISILQSSLNDGHAPLHRSKHGLKREKMSVWGTGKLQILRYWILFNCSLLNLLFIW